MRKLFVVAVMTALTMFGTTSAFAQAQGGAFLPTADYTLTGTWTFTTAPIFPVGTASTSAVTVGGTQTLTNKTLTAPVFGGSITGTYTLAGTPTITSPSITTPTITTGLAASGSAANDFSASTGTFLTSSGANTLSGAVTVGDATTPSVSLAAGKTNTGFFLVNGKTSGSTKFITADATAQAVIVSTAAQTSGGSTLTIPDQAGVSSNFVFTTLAQTLSNKTLTAPVVATISNTGTMTLPSATGGVPVTLYCGSTGVGNQTCSAAAAAATTKIYAGHSTLSSNAAVITFSPAFASTTYDCVANDITTRANVVQMLSTSNATATITNTTGASDVINWICVGQ